MTRRLKQLWLTLLCATLVPVVMAVDEDHAGHGAASTAPPAGDGAEERVPLSVSPQAQTGAGLQTRKAVRTTLVHTIRTVATVASDQTREARVTSRISGWIERIHADYVGKPIRKGAPLFDLYSPDLVSTQNEYLSAIRQGGALAVEVAAAAEMRLRQWGVPEAEIARLKSGGHARRTLTFIAPVDGVIVSKAAIQGAYVTPATELYALADLSHVWLQLTLYEADVALVRPGDRVDITLPYDRSRHYAGRIDYIYPELDLQTRTAKARVVLPNPDGLLRPGMFANAEIVKELRDVLVIPDDAVIDTGVRNLVFVQTSTRDFEPREVQVGPRIAGQRSILSGLGEGEPVVVGASFLIDAESRMQAALRRGRAAAAGHGDHGKQ